MDIDSLRDLSILRLLCLLGASAIALGVAVLTAAWRARRRSSGRDQGKVAQLSHEPQ